MSTLLLSSLGATGCLAHERPDEATDAGYVPHVDTSLDLPDGWISPAPDAWVPEGVDAGPPAACTLTELSVGVRVEPITTDTARCTFTHQDGASITGIEAAPADDGIRLHLDLCPGADADCRCDVVVANVGTDIASTLGPIASVAIDIGPGEGFVPGAFLAITKAPTCECDGCGCSEPLYLYAANTPPDYAPFVPAPMMFSNGAVVCPMTSCTFGGSSMLHARGDASEADVPGGTQRDLGSVHVRSVRDVEVFAPCAACAACGTPIGAWIAWVTSA